MRTTTRTGWRFDFSISTLGRLLGKSPVTLRGWENKGLLTFPRDTGGDRKLGTQDVRRAAQFALSSKRISASRANLIAAAMTLLEEIEASNNRKVKR